MPSAADEAGGQVTIVSSDKDLMQLIRPGVEMLDPIKQKPIGPAEVMEKFGVTPDKMIDVQALIGDSIDNVPGVPGIGPKGAAQLINEFGDLEAVLAAAPAMKPSKRRDMLIEHAEKARLSRELVTLRDDTPMPLPVDAAGSARPYDKATLATWLTHAGLPQHRRRGWAWTARRRRRRDARRPRRAALRPHCRCPKLSAAGRRGRIGLRSVRDRHHRSRAARLPGRERRPAGVVAHRYRDRRAGPDARASWSACRSPSRRAAPATCRCGTRGWRSRCRSPTAIAALRPGADRSAAS